MRDRRMIRWVVSLVAATAVVVGGGALTAAVWAAGPTITVKGANFNPRFGPDGVILHECPLSVIYAGGAPSGTVTVDVVTVAPTVPAGKSILVGGARTVALNSSGGATVAISANDFTFTGVVSQPDPNADLFKIEVVINPGPTTSTFWVADCDQTGTPPPPTTAPPTTTATTTATTAAPTTTTPTIGGTSATSIPTQVLAQTLTNQPSSGGQTPANALAAQAVNQPALAKTGSHTGVLLMVAVWLLLIGLAVTVFSKLGRAKAR
jgi:hypothetical protein